MIVPMLKYTFLVYHKDYNQFLESLKNLGMIHIAESESSKSEDFRENLQYLNRIDRVIRKLKKLAPQAEINPQKGNVAEGKKVFEEIEEMEHFLEQQHHRINILRKEIHELSPWGHFSLETIEKLKKHGITTHLFVCPKRQYQEEWEQQYAIGVVNEIAGNIYFALFQEKNQPIEINAEEVRIPNYTLSSLEETLARIEEENERITTKFQQFADEKLSDLAAYHLSFIETIEYQKVEKSTLSEAEDKLKILEGWIPSNKAEELNAFLDSQNTVYFSQKPSPEDKVPILLKNNKFAEKFEVIGELYSLPKYGELDLTPFFAPFYTLFFGFCLGDAGYGLLMILAALLFFRKVPSQLKPILTLISFLGASTIIFGLIGGTFFGVNLYETNLPIYRDLQAMFIEQNTNINNFMFKLSLILGGIQILFGMILKAINEWRMLGWKLAIGTIGWVFTIVGLGVYYLLDSQQILPKEQTDLLLYIILGIGGLLTLVINNLTRNPLINVGAGLWNAYNMVTGILGDTLSYIRLFALGISSGILGYVFNTLALSMSGSVIGVFFMIVVLIIGHGINLFMSGLGSFVHPIRLTFVEFYKNAGFTGGGKKYRPFKKLI
ncbi:MAG TPA: V-type ATPase 116kDa subunit family protein [Salinivirgaceae bacterium]|nr:V-type ATPase 116kDa subunit family protein [Salinivirgaceae bacterium]